MNGGGQGLGDGVLGCRWLTNSRAAGGALLGDGQRWADAAGDGVIDDGKGWVLGWFFGGRVMGSTMVDGK
ncbi:hypothetical protein Dimus_036405 [Dionaea muscipula]